MARTIAERRLDPDPGAKTVYLKAEDDQGRVLMKPHVTEIPHHL